MSRATLILGVLTGACVILHGALMPSLALFGGRLNLLVALVAGTALHYGTTTGMTIGLAAGLLADALFAGAFGLTAIPLVVIGYLAGQVERQFFRDELLVTVAVGFISIVGFELLVLLLSRHAFGVWWGGAFYRAFVPTVLVNGAFMPVLIFWLFRILPRRKREVI
ncbi:MAG: rod shape-determining protein MreD [Selenomonadales bacterium]|nr:rod shape-determining protein MreD [Selenomonadales bacterium]